MRNGKQHVVEIATMSLDILDSVSQLEIPHMPGTNYQLRIGMHSGKHSKQPKQQANVKWAGHKVGGA